MCLDGRHVWRVHGLGGWCLEERKLDCAIEVTQQVLNCGVEPGEVLKLPGGPFRALLRRP